MSLGCVEGNLEVLKSLPLLHRGSHCVFHHGTWIAAQYSPSLFCSGSLGVNGFGQVLLFNFTHPHLSVISNFRPPLPLFHYRCSYSYFYFCFPGLSLSLCMTNMLCCLRKDANVSLTLSRGNSLNNKSWHWMFCQNHLFFLIIFEFFILKNNIVQMFLNGLAYLVSSSVLLEHINTCDFCTVFWE